MQKGWLEMRRLIVRKICDRLEESFGREACGEARQQPSLSLHEVDELLAFRSDARLDELREALARIESDTFGLCLACRGRIEHRLLEHDPAQRLCGQCERRLFHVQESHRGVVQYLAL
jgi:RNA polymerase-binding transcription factor DksA